MRWLDIFSIYSLVFRQNNWSKTKYEFQNLNLLVDDKSSGLQSVKSSQMRYKLCTKLALCSQLDIFQSAITLFSPSSRFCINSWIWFPGRIFENSWLKKLSQVLIKKTRIYFTINQTTLIAIWSHAISKLWSAFLEHLKLPEMYM